MDLEKVNELAEMFNRILAPSRAMEWGRDATIPDYPASAEVAEAAEDCTPRVLVRSRVLAGRSPMPRRISRPGA